jgi:hypothetical protein
MFLKVSRAAHVPIALAALSLFTAGCNKFGGDVSGKVTVDGKIVQTGSVIFHCENGMSGTAIINDDGTYTVVRPPKGMCKVTVQSVPPGTAQPGSGVKVPSVGADNDKDKSKQPELPTSGSTKIEYIEIPDRYRDPAKTPLTFEVTSGGHTFNIEMKK